MLAELLVMAAGLAQMYQMPCDQAGISACAVCHFWVADGICSGCRLSSMLLVDNICQSVDPLCNLVVC